MIHLIKILVAKNFEIPTDVDYFHCTSNNTIYGTQIKKFPNTSNIVVCDMSSDIFSRKIDINKFDLIYAGAQKIWVCRNYFSYKR